MPRGPLQTATIEDAIQPPLISLHMAVELVADRKLTPVLGRSPGTARPRLAEAWRSGLSLENIRRNLEAAPAMYLGDNGEDFSALVIAAEDMQLDDLLRRAFRQTLATANGIKGPLADAVGNAPRRAAVEKLAREAKARARSSPRHQSPSAVS